jgi:hypothetical protein
MLLQALVAYAGVTLSAVATALGVKLRAGRVTAEGDLDLRWTLGIAKLIAESRINLDFLPSARHSPVLGGEEAGN